MTHIGFEILALAKKYGAIPTDDRHFAEDCAKLVEEKFTSTNNAMDAIATALMNELSALNPALIGFEESVRSIVERWQQHN